MTENPFRSILAEVARAHDAWAAASDAVRGMGMVRGTLAGTVVGAAVGDRACGDARVDDAVAGDVVVDFDDLPEAALAAMNHACGVLRRQVDAVQVRVSVAVSRRSAADRGPESFAKRNGFRTPAVLIAATTGITVGEATRLVTVGEATAPRVTFDGTFAPARHPHIAEALNAASIGVAAAAAIVAMLDRVGPQTDKAVLDAAERTLVMQAVGLTPDQVQKILTQAEATLISHGALEAKVQDLRSQRCLRMFERDGMLHITAKLDPETAAPVKTALEALVTTEYRNTTTKTASKRGLLSDQSAGHAATSRVRQRHNHSHVALTSPSFVDTTPGGTDGVGRTGSVGDTGNTRDTRPVTTLSGGRAPGCDPAAGLTHEDDRPEGYTPTESCTPTGDADSCDGDDLLREGADTPYRTVPQMQADAIAALAAHLLGCADANTPMTGPTVIVRVNLTDIQSGTGVATIDGITHPVTVATARNLAATGGIIPTVLGGASETLDWGREKRLFTRAQRLALVERDGGCAMCGLPPGMTKAHHINWWSRDHGHTNLTNGVLLCETCHHRIHDNGWTIRVQGSGPGGKVWFIPPPDIDPARTPQPGGRARYHYAPTPTPHHPPVFTPAA